MDVTILAVTKRYEGICIAGVNNALRWIRPVKTESLMLEDIRLSNGGYTVVSKVYDFPLNTTHAPNHYQTENHIIDESRTISYIRTLTDVQRNDLFSRLSESPLVTAENSDMSEVLKSRHRSLILLGPVEIESASIDRDCNVNPPKLTCRVAFRVNGIQVHGQNNVTNLPCTDLKYRAFARNLLNQRNVDYLQLTGAELQEQLGFDQVFIAIGLTGRSRGSHGDYWPMIIGFHTIPDYEQEINYNDL